MKNTDFKFGQLVSINHTVYRCMHCARNAGCYNCDIQNDMEDVFLNAHHDIRDSYYKICDRCDFFMTFKRLSK